MIDRSGDGFLLFFVVVIVVILKPPAGGHTPLIFWGLRFLACITCGADGRCTVYPTIPIGTEGLGKPQLYVWSVAGEKSNEISSPSSSRNLNLISFYK